MGRKRLHFSGLGVLERLGFTFSVDFDERLIWEAPATLDQALAYATVSDFNDEIVQSILSRARGALYRCMGGPCDGKPHGWGSSLGFSSAGVKVRKCVNVCHGKWAVYELQEDGRAFFRGYATSEVKGRRGVGLVRT